MSKKKKTDRGRPELPPEERRDSVIIIRVLQSEREAYDKAVAKKGIKLSDWIRTVLNRAASRK